MNAKGHRLAADEPADKFMREAIRLAFRGMRQGRGGPFGAVIVHRGRVLARGMNSVTSRQDPTAHAEMLAIRRACRKLGRFHLADCQLYTSCEPCPMCWAAIHWARLPQVFYANTRADAAAVGFDDEFLYQELTRPLHRRRVAMRRVPRDEALAAFAEWRDKPDKIPY
jgi:guanine deaminase